MLSEPDPRPLYLQAQKLQRLFSLLAGAGGIQVLLAGVRNASEAQQLVGALILTLGLAMAMTASLWDREGHLASFGLAKKKDDRLVQLIAWLMKDVQSYIAAVAAVGGAFYGWGLAGLQGALLGLLLGFVAGFATGMLVVALAWLFRILL